MLASDDKNFEWAPDRKPLQKEPNIRYDPLDQPIAAGVRTNCRWTRDALLRQ